MAFSSSTVISGQVTKKTDYDRLMDNTVHILRSATTFTGAKTFTSTISANDGITVPVMHVQDQKAYNVAGGTFTSGAWRTRTLNTILSNTITGASLASNQITLPAGTYKVTASAPAYAVNSHTIRFYNTSDSVKLIDGRNLYATASSSVESVSLLCGLFTITSEKICELQHQCQTTKTTNGLGVEVLFAGETSIYADVFIEKLA